MIKILSSEDQQAFREMAFVFATNEIKPKASDPGTDKRNHAVRGCRAV